jgi:hypothetical protein
MPLRSFTFRRLVKVLLLGSGYVSPPVVDYIMRDPSNRLTIGALFIDRCSVTPPHCSVASAEPEKAEELAKEYSPVLVKAVQLDATDERALEALVQQHNIVIRCARSPDFATSSPHAAQPAASASAPHRGQVLHQAQEAHGHRLVHLARTEGLSLFSMALPSARLRSLPLVALLLVLLLFLISV